MKARYYVIGDIADIDLLKSQLSQSFITIYETKANTTFEALDSFDWWLYHKGWQLFRQGRRYDLIEQETERVFSSIIANNDRFVQFCWEFPDSEFSRFLEPILEMRALLPTARIAKESTQISLCNADEKIVARLQIDVFVANKIKNTVVRCRPVAVWGYQKEIRVVEAAIEALALPPAKVSPVLTIIKNSGSNPGGNSSKIHISLKPDMPAAEAVRQIMENLVQVMHLNLPGIHQDIDSEFLHDFRVSVRRSRSLLGQLKGVLDADTTVILQEQLKAMGALTGDVRDLDVYLLQKEAYIELVPDVLTPGILELFRTLQRKRRYALDRMIKAMNGDAFTSAMNVLDQFVQSDPLAASESLSGKRPILYVAKAVIYKRYRRIAKKGRRINGSTPDEKLHELRIDCKKLRYLLEFFSSLFPKKQMKKLIKQLKQLQDNLGEFNDLSIQQDFLIGYLNSIKPQTAHAVKLSAAIGGLIVRLATAHQKVRNQFLSAFEIFNTPENHKRFKALFD
jgi:CHAD domain-containing protein